MDMTPILILFLIAMSAFFSSSETALTSVSSVKMQAKADRGNLFAKKVTKLLENRGSLVAAILIGNNVVNIVATALATVYAVDLFGERGVFISTVVMTLLVLLFAEILPKQFAIRYATMLSLVVAYPIDLIAKLFAPAVIVVNLFVAAITFGRVSGKSSETATVEDLREMVTALSNNAEESDSETQESGDMVSAILDLGERSVEEVMQPRHNVEMLDLEDDLEDIMKDILESNYTRLPLYRGSKDNVVGILHSKSLLKLLHEEEHITKMHLVAASQRHWYIADTTTLKDQLQEFKARREHFALVLDEYGLFKGIVTLEDVIEEIVGEIHDETDEEASNEPEEKTEETYSWVLEGQSSLRDVNKRCQVELEDEDISTLAGYVIKLARGFPQELELVFDEKRDLVFRVTKKEKNHVIKEIEIFKKDDLPQELWQDLLKKNF